MTISLPDIYNLKLRLLYDLKDKEALVNTIHSFEEFLRTNIVLSEERKKKNRNFIKILKTILITGKNGSKIDIGYLKSVQLKKIEMSNQEWLQDKLLELEKTTPLSRLTDGQA